jgi:uncharacterized protein YbaP (TraB family)
MAMKLYIILLFLFTSAFAFGQNRKGLLWKISGNGLKESSYLFGTIHAIPKDDFFIPQGLIPSFLECKSIVLETGPTLTISDSSLKKELMMPNGHTIKELYKQRDYLFLQRYFIDSLKGSITNIINIKPMWILSFISTRWFQNYVAYESMFTNKATENNKALLGLETTEEQIEFFNQISLRQQAKILLNTVKNRQEEERYYATALQAYLMQDIDQLNNQIHSQFKKYTKYYDVFFTSRNASWVTKIDTLIRNQSCFIAVGAGHLGGQDGLIEKLQKMGYIINPLY